MVTGRRSGSVLAFNPRRTVALASPTLTSIALRAAQLLVLVALSRAAPDGARGQLVADFALISAGAMLSDSGASNYLLFARGPSGRGGLRRVLEIQTATAVVGATASVSYAVLSLDMQWDSASTAVIIALALAQVLDGLVRVARMPLLVERRDQEFARFDLYLAGAKIPGIALAVVADEILWLLLLPVASLAVFVAVVLRAIPPRQGEQPSLTDVLTYGVAGMASGLYSQGPILVSAALLPVSSVAMLAICYRTLQPIELVPATISQQVASRARVGQARVVISTLAIAALGAVVAVAYLLLLPLLESVFEVHFDPVVFVLVLALSVPVKFANYSLSAFLLVTGAVRTKLAITLVLGVVTLALAVLTGGAGSLVGMAGVSLFAEVCLAIALCIAIGRDAKAVTP